MSSRDQMREGRGVFLQKGISGAAASMRASRSTFPHPWLTAAVWDAKGEQWVCTARAGLVNGIAPIFRTTAAEQAEAGRDFGKNPLTGKPYFSDRVFQKEADTTPIAERAIDLPLYLQPAIPLRDWRSLGSDGFPGSDPVPAFFLDRGADQFEAEHPVPADKVRRLRAMDLILHQPRVAITSTITTETGALTGVANVRQTLTARAPQASDTLRVYAGHFLPPGEPDPLAEIYEEPTWDEIRIATVFLLSPPGAKAGSQPDGGWRAFVEHELFWNLHYVPAPLFRAPDIYPDGPFIIPLAGLLAQPIVNQILSSGNDAAQQAANLIAARSLAGTWWTPTGGGSDATFPAIVGTARQSGLDKAANLEASAAAKRAALRATAVRSLDPSFPFRAVAFDPARLSAA